MAALRSLYYKLQESYASKQMQLQESKQTLSSPSHLAPVQQENYSVVWAAERHCWDATALGSKAHFGACTLQPGDVLDAKRDAIAWCEQWCRLLHEWCRSSVVGWDTCARAPQREGISSPAVPTPLGHGAAAQQGTPSPPREAPPRQEMQLLTSCLWEQGSGGWRARIVKTKIFKPADASNRAAIEAQLTAAQKWLAAQAGSPPPARPQRSNPTIPAAASHQPPVVFAPRPLAAMRQAAPPLNEDSVHAQQGAATVCRSKAKPAPLDQTGAHSPAALCLSDASTAASPLSCTHSSQPSPVPPALSASAGPSPTVRTVVLGFSGLHLEVPEGATEPKATSEDEQARGRPATLAAAPQPPRSKKVCGVRNPTGWPAAGCWPPFLGISLVLRASILCRASPMRPRWSCHGQSARSWRSPKGPKHLWRALSIHFGSAGSKRRPLRRQSWRAMRGTRYAAEHTWVPHAVTSFPPCQQTKVERVKREVKVPVKHERSSPAATPETHKVGRQAGTLVRCAYPRCAAEQLPDPMPSSHLASAVSAENAASPPAR